MVEKWEKNPSVVSAVKVKEADGLRRVEIGRQKVASMPVDADFLKAAVWNVSLPDTFSTVDNKFLTIDYCGDVARIYADGKLVADNFWNGKAMVVRLSDLVGKKVELRVLPLGADYPIYLQKEQRMLLEQAGGSLLRLNNIGIVERNDYKYND